MEKKPQHLNTNQCDLTSQPQATNQSVEEKER